MEVVVAASREAVTVVVDAAEEEVPVGGVVVVLEVPLREARVEISFVAAATNVAKRE